MLLSAAPVAAAQGRCSTDWVSKSSSGQPAMAHCRQPAVSTDARFVAFVSEASNLVPGDTNQTYDVFVFDRRLDNVERVSVGTGGIQGNGKSLMPDISGDGRYVVFVSESTNWDPRDTHPGPDLYLRDRVNQTTELLSVAFAPPVDPLGGSGSPKISPDGRFVAFEHSEDNILPGDANGYSDIFLLDRTTGVTELVSIDSASLQADNYCDKPAMSADGRFVAFTSNATNWYPGNRPKPLSYVYVYVRDRATKTLTPVNLNANGTLGPGSADWDIDLSADGRYLAYLYRWANALDPTLTWKTEGFVRDLVTGETQPVAFSVFGNNGSAGHLDNGLGPDNPTISADGRFVAFDSRYHEHVLHSGNRAGVNVFIHDRLTGLTQAASLGPDGQWPSLPPQTAAEAFESCVSADGSSVAFICEDPTFGSGNAFYNVYVRSCDWTQPQVYCEAQVNSLGCRPSIEFSGAPSASAGSGFTVEARDVLGGKLGMFFYSTGLPILTPLGTGYLCMELPIQRTPLQGTGGGPPPGCDGTLSVDFNAWIATGADPSLVPGENVCIQAWSRDAASASGGNLTDAVAFLVGF